MNTELMFSSNDMTWYTPHDLFNRLNREFHFTLDPCAYFNTAKCFHYYDPEQNGLVQDWSNERVFCNPPYGREIYTWVQKCYEESLKGALVVMLIPARVDTLYFHNFCLKAKEIRFIKGRLKFGGSNNPAPFPSMIVIFDNTNNTELKVSPYIQKLQPLLEYDNPLPLISYI